MDDRAERQIEVEKWVIKTFGSQCLHSIEERVLRVVEEAIELAQAEMVPREKIEALLSHVFSKEPGNPKQELGGLGVTVLAYAASKRINCDTMELIELERIKNISPGYFRVKQNIKAAKHLAVKVTE